MHDLFLNKEEQLLMWCKEKKIFSKADILEYGLKNFYLRADRTVRDFVNELKISRIPEKEAKLMGCRGKMAWYRCL